MPAKKTPTKKVTQKTAVKKTVNKKDTPKVAKPKVYKLFSFDLDGTLAESKQPISKAMAECLVGLLLKKKPIVILTGGKFDSIKDQVVAPVLAVIKARAKKATGAELKALQPQNLLKNLSMLAVSGTQHFEFSGLDESGETVWSKIYEEVLTASEKMAAVDVLLSVAAEMDLLGLEPEGELIEDRGGQITYSALGQSASIERKNSWDPKRILRDELAKKAQLLLPTLEVRPGGATSVDITRIGTNKGTGLKRLLLSRGIAVEKVHYVGDKFSDGGNDFPVMKLGVDCLEVKRPTDTLKFLKSLVASL